MVHIQVSVHCYIIVVVSLFYCACAIKCVCLNFSFLKIYQKKKKYTASKFQLKSFYSVFLFMQTEDYAYMELF